MDCLQKKCIESLCYNSVTPKKQKTIICSRAERFAAESFWINFLNENIGQGNKHGTVLFLWNRFTGKEFWKAVKIQVPFCWNR